MSGYQNIGLKGYFKRYGIKNAITRGLFTGSPFHLVKDYEMKKLLYYRKAYKWIEKKYWNACDTYPEGLITYDMELNQPIWVYWKQGIDQAPEIVKRCVQSIKAHTSSEVILLSEDSLQQYLKMPDNIIEKLNKGYISAAHYADLIRFTLLAAYGGTWIDATVFMTGDLPDYISKSEFFAFSDSFGLIDNPAQISNWLLHCARNNPVMCKTRNISFMYWKNEKHVIDYLFTYLILTMALRSEDKNVNMPYVNSENCKRMLEILDQPFDVNIYEHIKNGSSIHKLTYKLDMEKCSRDDTLYRHILEEEDNEKNYN